MNALIVNPPWKTDKGYGIRTNSRWPHVRPDKHLQFPIYLAYTAAVLKADGHDVRVIDAVAEEMDAGALLHAIREATPDAVFMESASPTFNQDIVNAEKIKDAGYPVYLFGTHISAFFEDLAPRHPFVDGWIRGEFEYIIRDIARGLPAADVCGLAFCDPVSGKLHVNPPMPLIENLDELPFPDRSLFNLDHYRIHLDPQPGALLIASRGCPYHCTYCIWPQVMYGHKQRMRSPGNICDEIEELIRDYGIIFFRFDDDTFALRAQPIIDFCEEFLRRGLEKKVSWTCFGHVNACNEDMYRILARANCRRIDFGIESGSPRILEVMKKRISIEKARNTFSLCRRYGIRTYADFMLGFPHETEEDILQTIDMARYLDPDYIQVSYVIPIPGTEMYFDGIRNGFIDPDLPLDKYDSTGQIVDTGDITEERLKILYNRFWKSFYLRPAFIFRELRRALSSKHEFLRVLRGARSFYTRVLSRRKL